MAPLSKQDFKLYFDDLSSHFRGCSKIVANRPYHIEEPSANERALGHFASLTALAIFTRLKKNQGLLNLNFKARVAELVDAVDLKSTGGCPPCRFESGPGHSSPYLSINF